MHLVEELDDPDDYPEIVTRHTPRQLKHFKVPTEVVIEQDPANERTLLELTAPDRPGLLARVGRVAGVAARLLVDKEAAGDGATDALHGRVLVHDAAVLLVRPVNRRGEAARGHGPRNRATDVRGRAR